MCPLLIGFTVLQVQRDLWLKFALDKVTPAVFMKDTQLTIGSSWNWKHTKI